MKKGRDRADEEIRRKVPDMRVSNLGQFFELLDVLSRYSGNSWLFRGVDDSLHGLRPKIGRADRKIKITMQGIAVGIPYKQADEGAAFERFVQGAAAFGRYESFKQIELLALAQHYGLPTRLLDWTDNFATAAWFAVRDPKSKLTGRGTSKQEVLCEPAIWIIRKVPFLRRSEFDTVFDLKELRIYRPRHIDMRIRAQQGVFTVHPEPDRDATIPGAYRIVIDPKLCFVLGKRLDALGINQSSMFPDLGGLASHVGWLYRNNWLGRTE